MKVMHINVNEMQSLLYQIKMEKQNKTDNSCWNASKRKMSIFICFLLKIGGWKMYI